MFKKSLMTFTALLALAGGASAADWPSGYSKCANEGSSCKAGSTPRQVSFGLKNKWVVSTLSGTVACTVATFGTDPNPGVTKKCAVGPLQQNAPTPAPTPAPAPVAEPVAEVKVNAIAEAAPARGGWASFDGGTTGGSDADVTSIFKVSSASQLLKVIKEAGTEPKIIVLNGTVDMAATDNGGKFKSQSDQKVRNRIDLQSNTTLIGTGADTTLVNAVINIKNAENVIVRNLRIVNPCDIAPEWDADDGKNGNWNSEYDGIVIENSRYVWIDHNHFTDAPVTDDLAPIQNGRPKQCHDGALDVKKGSDYVTVSYNVFELHEKNNLIGSSDSASGDDGHLKVTFHHNRFTHVSERSPRVRFGRVHLYNNLYEGDRSRSLYPHKYSIGVGYKAKIISENNAFDITGATSCKDIVKNPGSSSKTGSIVDRGSLLNNAALNLASQCSFSSAVNWKTPYEYTLQSVSEARKSVLDSAGTGKLTVY